MSQDEAYRAGPLAAGVRERAVSELLESHRAQLVRHAARSLPAGDRCDAEDVVQEAFLRALRAYDNGTTPANVSAWLHTITRNCAIDLARARAARPTCELQPSDAHGIDPVETTVERADQLQAVIGAIGDLPARQREALVDVTFRDRSYDEIAVRQSTTVAAVKSLVHRARTSVRDAAGTLAAGPVWWVDRLRSIGLTAHDHVTSAASSLGAPAMSLAAVGGASLVAAVPTVLPTASPSTPLLRPALASIGSRTPPATQVDARPAPRRSGLAAAATNPASAPFTLEHCVGEATPSRGYPNRTLLRALTRSNGDRHEYEASCDAELRLALLRGR